MSNQRSPRELDLLKKEAERRMRRGDDRIDIADDLGISVSTLRDWAAKGGWRKKDIAFERSEERGQALLAQIAETQTRQHVEAEGRAAKAKELGDAAMKAMKAADPDGSGTPPGMAAQPAHQLSLSMAYALLQQGRLDDADRAARFALRFAQAQKATNEQDSAQWRVDREQMLAWWKRNRDGILSFHKHASDAIGDLKSLTRYQRLAQEAGTCPTCSRPADFWPAEMNEVSEAMVDRMEENEFAEKAEEAEQEQIRLDEEHGW
ncbi:MAG: hypothetical protein Q8R02_04870 [Hyphomonadaceae bacterium]|nr:hypothetical protein [Hyphomonadaceae bacterium]